MAVSQAAQTARSRAGTSGATAIASATIILYRGT
jgi:hypothetical protein